MRASASGAMRPKTLPGDWSGGRGHVRQRAPLAPPRATPRSPPSDGPNRNVSLGDLFTFESELVKEEAAAEAPPPPVPAARRPATEAPPPAARRPAAEAPPPAARLSAADAPPPAARIPVDEAPPAAARRPDAEAPLGRRRSAPSAARRRSDQKPVVPKPAPAAPATAAPAAPASSGGSSGGGNTSVRREKKLNYSSSRDTFIRSSTMGGWPSPSPTRAGGPDAPAVPSAAAPPPSLAFMEQLTGSRDEGDGAMLGGQGGLSLSPDGGASAGEGGGAGGTSASTPWDSPGFGTFRGGRLFESPAAQLAKQQQQQPERASLQFAEPETLLTSATLELASQEAADAAAARLVELPPLQSVLELTTAWRPPQRTGEETEEDVAAAAQATGMSLPEGSGVLADGTTYERTSGEEKAANGWWYRWTQISGATADGTKWVEKWWEISDWTGAREMGAEKSGTRLDGSAWVETWKEALAFDAATGQPVVERTAHKRANDALSGTEWEEQWGEKYGRGGWADKYADKWGREGTDIWHEKWGENYDGAGGCVKYTDRWTERMDATGTYVEGKWGDKWEERFTDGKGSKNGETWSQGSDGSSFSRHWGEDHLGEGWVRKHGHSTAGEQWDSTEQSGTHYNPIPHFDYELALKHSNELLGVGLLPRGAAPRPGGGGDEDDDDDPFGGGLDAL